MTKEVFYTETFFTGAGIVTDFLSQNIPANQAIAMIDKARMAFERRVSEHPESCHLSPGLVELGLNSVREYSASSPFTITYRYDATGEKVYALTFSHQKQDLTKLLNKLAIMI